MKKKFIDRVRLPDANMLSMETERAYRLPETSSRRWVGCYVPNKEHGIHAKRIKYTSKNRKWYATLNRATRAMHGMGIEHIQIHGESRYLHITLTRLNAPVTDYGNLWKKIEEVLEREVGHPIRDHTPQELKWWPESKRKS